MAEGQHLRLKHRTIRADPIPRPHYIPDAIKQVVKRNLEMILGDGECQMQSLLSGESMAGNASTWKGMPCITANFFFDRYTGDIIYSANERKASEYNRKRSQIHMFRFAWNREEDKTRIVTYFSPRNATIVAQITLAETVRQYNKKYGF